MLKYIFYKFLTFLINTRIPSADENWDVSVCPTFPIRGVRTFLSALVGFLCFVLLVPGLLLSQTEFEGNISGEWEAEGNPYIQVGNTVVPENEALLILPGVEVILGEEMTFTVEGIITAQGSPEDTIYFNNPEGVAPPGISLFTGPEDTCRFSFCRFDSLLDGIESLNCSVIIESSSFFTCNRATNLVQGWARVTNCFITSVDSVHWGDMIIGDHRSPGGIYDVIENVVIGNRMIWIRGADSVFVSGNSGHKLLFWNVSNGHSTNNMVETIQLRNCRPPFNITGNVVQAMILNGGGPYTIQDNFADRLTAGESAFEAFDNTFSYVRSFESVGVLERNLISGPVELDNIAGRSELALINNTIYIDTQQELPNTAIIRGDNSNITQFSNNIIYSNRLVGYGIEEDIEVRSGGYNCFYGLNTAYGDRNLLEGDIEADPLFRGGRDDDHRLRADSPCVDAGDPDSPEDPDGTRADIGVLPFDQENGMPPTIISQMDAFTGWGMDFQYIAIANDEGDELEFDFEGLPEWLEPERRDFVSDTLVLSGEVPREQESFSFIIHVIDEDVMDDTLSVQVFVYPFTVLTGQIGGVLDVDNSPYLVADTAYVAGDDSLIIEPGCEIYCDDTINGGRSHSVLLSAGHVRAVGTEEDSILFKTLNRSGSRRFLRISENRDLVSEFRYCHFNGAGVLIIGQNGNINHCFNNNASLGISGDGIHFDFQHNVGRGAGLRGVGVVANNRLRGQISVGGDSVEVFNNHFERGTIYLSAYGIRHARIHHNIFDSSAGSKAIDLTVFDFEDAFLNGDVIVNSNYVKYCITGLQTQGYFSNVLAQNNIFNGATEQAIREVEGDYNALITNNVLSNSSTGLYFRDVGGQFMENIHTENNLFINNDILFNIRHPNIEYQSFRYNACFNFDSLGNDMTYIGRINQVNANGDSSDTGFNIFLDPHIANLDCLDFHLFEDSPLIDAGNPDSAFFDLDGTVNDIGLYGGPFGEVYDYPEEIGESVVPVPDGFSIGLPYPNPFNSATHLTFATPLPGNVEVKIFDTIGRIVLKERLVSLQAGRHHYIWQGIDDAGRGLSTGIYYIELTFRDSKLVRQVIMLK